MKKNALGVVSFVALLALAGCGEDNSQSQQAQAPQPQAETTPAPQAEPAPAAEAPAPEAPAAGTQTAEAPAAAPAGGSGGQVNVYNWSDYIGENTVAEFQKATGITVQYDVFTDLETLESKLLVGNSGYDVIVPTAEPTLAKLIQAGAVQKLDKSKIPNLSNLDPVLMKLVADTDPGNEYAAIYQWGTIGLGVNVDRVKEVAPDIPMDSWQMLFNPENAAKLAQCGIVLLDSATDVLPTVYHYLGLDPNSESPEDLAKVEETLLAIRPHIKAFVPSVIDPLATGDACVALGYSGDVFQAQARAEEAGSGANIDYLIPNEGVQIWFDVMAIPAGAPNLDNAHAWINYVLQPEVMAGISDYVAYANAVPASKPLMDQEIANNEKIFPTPEQQEKMFTVQQVSQSADRDRTRTWTRVETGR
ncbi:polyamine ABC transporter substrate-binding protein [Indioceanicola profundi]|uniref:polyamine ABC transporter substrate-binding protein n=1 Tax=Indioceanicola profundi TaxID=2220096 RepID=UPI001969618C|nr:polyamine ABC transporter substrate-binding protein [Indioceanicola profundi]